MKTIQEKTTDIYKQMSKEFGYTNVMQTPKIVKVVVSAGVGSFKDKKKIELVADRLGKITGQKAAKRGAKQSVAAFKVREGDTVGYQITMRGKRMLAFLDKLINVALPRTKDFRGVTANAIDEMGNFTLGIREHIIFPETADEELKDVFGLAITIVTTAKTKAEAKAFLSLIGMPFKKVEEKKK